MAILGEFLDLNFIAMEIDELPVCIFEFDSEVLYLLGESFDFDGLEDNNQVEVRGQIYLVMVVAGEMFDAGSEWEGRYCLVLSYSWRLGTVVVKMPLLVVGDV